MRRVLIAAVAVCALMVGAVSPAGGQEFGILTIDPTEGPVGEVVDTTLPTDVIAENCVADAEAFSASVVETWLDVGSVGEAALIEYVNDVYGGDFPDDVDTNPESFAFIAFVGTLLGLSGFLGPEPAEQAWGSTFVLTFATLEQELVGDMGSYDPVTGEGQITVPDTAPGTYAIAAVCLGLNQAPTAFGTVAPAIAAGTQSVLENLTAPYPSNLFDPAFAEAAGIVAPAILGADPFGDGVLNISGGPWVELFCVWNANDECPVEPPPNGGNGEGGGEGPAEAVATAPRFTG